MTSRLSNDRNGQSVARSCPHCGGVTPDIRVVVITRLTFLVAVVFYRTETIEGCPQCLRKLIVSSTLADFLPANLLWPIVACLNGIDYLKTWRANTNWDDLTEADQKARIASRRVWDWLIIFLVAMGLGCGGVVILAMSIYTHARGW
jgi:hypothetical protein